MMERFVRARFVFYDNDLIDIFIIYAVLAQEVNVIYVITSISKI